MDTLLWSFSAL
uniref:Uncharacterized protein n=1 Tax=Rhizophora mucronata TaxID=61149 RepID=A0A2P2NWC4_RHIMU